MIDGKPYRQAGEIIPGRIVCVADHASNRVPEGVELGLDPAVLETHIALDIGTEGIADRLARRHGIAAHIATVSRLVCDFNREEGRASIVPMESDGHTIAGNIGADVGKRLSLYYQPYHAALARWLAAAEPSLIVSLHSFTPKLESRPGEERPWQVGLLYNQDGEAAQHAIGLLRDEGLNVGDNQPYSGRDLNATMNIHAEAKGRPYLAIEIRQDLIANEAQQARWAALIANLARRTLMAMRAF